MRRWFNLDHKSDALSEHRPTAPHLSWNEILKMKYITQNKDKNRNVTYLIEGQTAQ